VTTQAVLDSLRNVRQRGDNYTACCPAHDDEKASLSVTEGRDGATLAHCHAGCTFDQIAAATPVDRSEWFPAQPQHGMPPSRVRVKRYPAVHAETGSAVADHVRKDMADGDKVMYWEPKLNGTRVADLALYGGDQLAELPDGAEVRVVEGEKCVDALRWLGLAVAGTVTGAAATPSDAALRPLVRLTPLLWADNDEGGRSHMEHIATRLLILGCSRVEGIRWPQAPAKGDAVDLIEEARRDGASREDITAKVTTLPREPMAVGSRIEFPVFSPKPESEWPNPPDGAAFRGLAGDVVATLRDHTEADDVALLVSFLVAAGTAIGPGPYVAVGEARHGVNLFAVTVGDSSRARKGHSWESTRRLIVDADPTMARQIVTGLSTGEGLIERVRDDLEVREWNKKTQTHDVRVEPGADDKRLLAVETEMARTLEVSRRDGNTLSAVLRQASDGVPLHVLTRKAPLAATGAHIAVLGHITKDELRRRLDDVSMANGFANRFLWCPVKRARKLSRPSPVNDADRRPLVERISDVIASARQRDRFLFDAGAEAAWDAAYPTLTEDRNGLVGALTARAEAHAIRLALLFALLDRDNAIRAEHIFAALAMVEFADHGVTYIFGDRVGDPTADTIVDALRRRGRLTRTEVSDMFGRHLSSSRLDSAVAELAASGAITVTEQSTAGRPVTVLALGTN
jgi:hypothetical protein